MYWHNIVQIHDFVHILICLIGLVIISLQFSACTFNIGYYYTQNNEMIFVGLRFILHFEQLEI